MVVGVFYCWFTIWTVVKRPCKYLCLHPWVSAALLGLRNKWLMEVPVSLAKQAGQLFQHLPQFLCSSQHSSSRSYPPPLPPGVRLQLLSPQPDAYITQLCWLSSSPGAWQEQPLLLGLWFSPRPCSGWTLPSACSLPYISPTPKIHTYILSWPAPTRRVNLGITGLGAGMTGSTFICGN